MIYTEIPYYKPDEIVSLQANYLNEQNVEYHLFAGDMFNDFQKTKSYFEKLNTLITGKAYFIAGNHDMLKNITFAGLENNNISDFICIMLTLIFLILIGVSLETMDGMIIVSPLL